MGDWIDKALEAATYTNIRKTQQHLEELKEMAEREAARKALIEAMRNFVFEVGSRAEIAEEHADSYPQQAYIVAKTLEWRLDNSGIESEMFPDIRDKEYFFKTKRNIKRLIQKTLSKMTEEEAAISNMAAKYLIEMPLLQRAIASKEAEEALNKTSREWSILQRKHKLFILGVIGIIMETCVICPIAGTISDNSAALEIVGVLVILGVLGGSVYLILRGRDPRYKEMKEMRERLEEQLLSEEERRAIQSTFGDLSLSQLREIEEERAGFLLEMLGEDFEALLPG